MSDGCGAHRIAGRSPTGASGAQAVRWGITPSRHRGRGRGVRLENHIERLAEDHANARLFAESIGGIDGVRIDPHDVESNLVFFEVDSHIGTAADVSDRLEEHGVVIGAMGPQRMRVCTHLDVSRDDVLKAAEALRTVAREPASVGATLRATSPYARG